MAPTLVPGRSLQRPPQAQTKSARALSQDDGFRKLPAEYRHSGVLGFHRLGFRVSGLWVRIPKSNNSCSIVLAFFQLRFWNLGVEDSEVWG